MLITSPEFINHGMQYPAERVHTGVYIDENRGIHKLQT